MLFEEKHLKALFLLINNVIITSCFIFYLYDLVVCLFIDIPPPLEDMTDSLTQARRFRELVICSDKCKLPTKVSSVVMIIIGYLHELSCFIQTLIFNDCIL